MGSGRRRKPNLSINSIVSQQLQVGTWNLAKMGTKKRNKIRGTFEELTKSCGKRLWLLQECQNLKKGCVDGFTVFHKSKSSTAIFCADELEQHWDNCTC